MYKISKFKLTIISFFVFVVIALLFFTFATISNTAFADGEQYYYIAQTTQNKTANSSTIVFRNTSGDPLFFVPETYYVKFISLESDSINISYMGMPGTFISTLDESHTKVTKTTISNTILTENNAYPNIELFVKEGTTFSFAEIDSSAEDLDSTIWKIYFMGEKTDDGISSDPNVIYVKLVNQDTIKYGIVNKTTFNTFSISSHQEVIDKINQAAQSSIETQPNTNNSKALRIILIIGLIIPCIIIVLLIFIPKKSEQYDKARMYSKNQSTVDYDKTRVQDPNQQAVVPPQQNNGYYPPQQPYQGGQPQYPPQNNGYYPPQQNNGYYPPQQPYQGGQPQYPPQNNYYPPQDNNYPYGPYDGGQQ